MCLDLAPAPRAVRVGAAIGRSDFAVDRRQFPQARNLDPLGEICDLSQLSGAGRNHEASELLGAPCGIVQRGKSATGNAEQMEAPELEMLSERIEIARNASRLRSRRGVGDALAPAPPVEGDDAVTGLRKACDLARPYHAGAGVGMEQHDRYARSAAVREPQFHAREFGIAAGNGIVGGAGRHGCPVSDQRRAQDAGKEYAPLDHTRPLQFPRTRQDLARPRAGHLPNITGIGPRSSAEYSRLADGVCRGWRAAAAASGVDRWLPVRP